MGVVDSFTEGLAIIKTIFNSQSTDELAFNIGASLTQNSLWVVEKAASLANFNKQYIAAQSFSEIQIQECILDPKNSLLNSQRNHYHMERSELKYLDEDEQKVVQGCMKKQGIRIVDATYLSGKTTMAVGVVQALLSSASVIKEQRERQRKSKKLKTYTIKELMDHDSSDDEGYQPPKKAITSFPWF